MLLVNIKNDKKNPVKPVPKIRAGMSAVVAYISSTLFRPQLKNI